MSENTRVVCVHRMTDPIEANLLKGLLQQEGIPAEISGEDLVGAYSGVPRVCDVRLLVPPAYRLAADALIKAYEAAKGAPPNESVWICAGCGEENAMSFETCWQCGHCQQDGATT
ncbi:MAG: DUF2007 domain-containing protein [Gammaproteobacteria bacterium]